MAVLSLASCGGGGADGQAGDRPIPATHLEQPAADTTPADPAGLMRLLSAATADPGRSVYPSDLLDWAERQYPQLFPSHEANRLLAPYTYRYYPGSGNFAGMSGDEVFVLGPISGGQLQSVGPAKALYCQVYAQECGQAPVTIDSELQARQLAARTADALFLYDALSYELMNGVFNGLWGDLGQGLQQPRLVAGRRSLPCQSGGSGQATIVDSDGSGTLSVGDRVLVSANGCVLDGGSGPQFSGELEIAISEGENMADFWNNGGRGLIELRLDYRGVRTRFGLVQGRYAYRSAWPQGQASGEDGSRFDTLAASGADGSSIRLTDVRLVLGPPVDGEHSTLLSASGALTTEVPGLGTLRNELSLPGPMRVGTQTLRYRPQDGVLRLSGKGYRVDLAYGAARAVEIRVDNGSDGSVERRLSTTEDQLDSLVRDF